MLCRFWDLIIFVCKPGPCYKTFNLICLHVDRCYTVIGIEMTDVFSFDAYLFALFLNKIEMGTAELQLLLIAMAAES